MKVPINSRKPDFCPFIYSDGVKLFLEFDGMVLDFIFSEAGLHKALKHIPRVDRQPGFLSGGTNLPTQEKLNGHIARKTPEPRLDSKSAAARRVAELRPKMKTDVVRLIREGKLK